MLAAVFWSANGLAIKLVNQGGQGPDGVTIAFYRSLFAGLFLLPLAWGKFHTLVKPRNVATPAAGGTLQALRRLSPALAVVVLFSLMTTCFSVANTKTEAANAIILQYTSTFWVFGLSPLMLGEKPSRRDLPILGLAMVGIVVIFVGRADTDLVGLLIALAAGLFYGLLTIMLRKMRNSDPAAVTVLSNLGSVALLLPAVLWIGDLAVSQRCLIILILMGAFQLGLPYYLFSHGLRRVPAHQAALVTLIEPVLVPVWTYLGLGETVPPTTLFGGGIVLVALVVFIGTAGKRRNVKTSKRRNI